MGLRISRRWAVALGAVFVLLAVGCGESRYTVRLLAPEGGFTDVAAFDVVLLRVTCQQILDNGGIGDRGWVAQRVQWQAGQPAAALGEVRPRRYALVALARRQGCGTAFAACVDTRFERGGEGTIEVPLQAIGGFGCLPQEVCAGGGICTEAPACDGVTVACDNDGDGFGNCLEGQSPPACDCNDESNHVFPGAPEQCNGEDDNCDGQGDENNPECIACLDRCDPPRQCQRRNCANGVDCVLETVPDGRDCVGESGPAFCCDGLCNGACAPAAVETEACGNCGQRERTCSADCQWGAWGACNEGAAECDPGTTQTSDCGNCGTLSETCSDACTWEPDGACAGEGVCAAGTDAAPVACGTCGMRVDTCDADCAWVTADCEPDPDRLVDCVGPDTCCPNGSCGQQGAECCGTDVSTCGPEALCMNWTCVDGTCTEVDEVAGTDPEDECGNLCCNGAGACAGC